MTGLEDNLLEIKKLAVEFKTSKGIARALDDISFELRRGETLAIVGESGCGKSMTSLAIMGLVPSPAGKVTAGQILLEGEDLLQANHSRMEDIRGNEIAMIFQEPMTALNPVFSIGYQIAETLCRHRGMKLSAARREAVELLSSVHIPEPQVRARQYPHQLSGGMRQRAMIAMALACRPRVLIADEPTTALDVTVQAQIFDLMRELQSEHGTSTILITHNMGAVAELADRVLVMYAGRIVERGEVGDIIRRPRHPYTRGLLDCVLHVESDPLPVEAKRLREIPGVVPPLTELGVGCAFAPRCPLADERCPREAPPLRSMDAGHGAACWKIDLMEAGTPQ